MKQLTLFVLTITSLSLYGQGKAKETPSEDHKRVQIGINISPDICYRTIRNNNASSISDIFITMRNQNETAKVGYTAGINACFNIKKNISLETGVQYSNKGYQLKMIDLIYAQPEPNAPNKAKNIYNFHCIDIPLKANFTIRKKRVSYFTSIGLTTNIFVNETQTSVLVYSDRTDRITNPTNIDYNRVNISPTIGFGMDYKINSKINFRVEPTFRHGLLKIIDSPVTGYLYSAGLNIGYYYEFKP